MDYARITMEYDGSEWMLQDYLWVAMGLYKLYMNWPWITRMLRMDCRWIMNILCMVCNRFLL